MSNINRCCLHVMYIYILTCLNVAPLKLLFSSGSRIRSFTNAIMAPFSTHECDSFEQ